MMKLIERTDHYRLEGIAECEACGGTGLYHGMAERDGACVVCWRCKGTGRVKISMKFNKFLLRKTKEGCERVYSNGMGYCITDMDITTERGDFFPFSKYGCAYGDWLKGAKPIPLKFLGCPYMETNQGLRSDDKNDLYKTRCEKNIGWGSIKDCKLFHEKRKCWEIFEGKRCRHKKQGG